MLIYTLCNAERCGSYSHNSNSLCLSIFDPNSQHLHIHRSTDLPSIHLQIYLSIDLQIHPSSDLPIHRSADLLIHLSTDPPI